MITLLGLLAMAEGAKVQLIPRPRQARTGPVMLEAEKQLAAADPVQGLPETLTLEESVPKQLTSGNDGVAVSVPLQAVLVTNQQGEHVLQLSVESSKALQTAMDAPPKTQATVESTQFTLPGEAPSPEQTLMDTPKTSVDPSEVRGRRWHFMSLLASLILFLTFNYLQPKTTLKDPPPAQASHPQDQLVIFSTVATMALLVGALSARRLRTRQMLNFCIENDSLEDDLAFDAAYTTKSTIGAASSFYGGYDTFSNSGSDFHSRFNSDLRWRGDLEKFDV
jgi:hypothetical protein